MQCTSHANEIAQLVALLRLEILRSVWRHDPFEVLDQRFDGCGHLALGEHKGARRQPVMRLRVIEAFFVRATRRPAFLRPMSSERRVFI